MMILHDAMKTIQNGVFVFFLLRTQLVLLKKTTKNPDLKNRRVVFFLKNGFFSTLIIFQFFFVIFP